MGFFNRKKHWTDKLPVNDTLKAQAKARYERRIASGNSRDVATHIVRVWALNEQRKLDRAKENDPWVSSTV